MKVSTNTVLIALVITSALVGCDESQDSPPRQGERAQESARETAAHPAAKAAQRFLRAIQYSDTRTAAETHVESTHEGFYCQSDEFQRVFSAAKKRAGEESCADAQALSNAALARLDDRARLAAQMLKVVCEEPEATCADYSRRVLEAQRDRWATWTQTLQRFEIQRTLGDDGEAVVYVDIYAVPRGDPEHRTLRMHNISDDWYVADPLLENAKPRSRQGGANGKNTHMNGTDPTYEPDFD
jgi:hypothetical protein